MLYEGVIFSKVFKCLWNWNRSMVKQVDCEINLRLLTLTLVGRQFHLLFASSRLLTFPDIDT